MHIGYARHQAFALMGVLVTCCMIPDLTEAKGDPQPNTPEDLRAELVVQLDKEHWSQDEAVTGRVVVALHWAEGSPHQDKIVVGLVEPRMSLVFGESPEPRELSQVVFSAPLAPLLRIGSRYEVPFTVRLTEICKQVAGQGDKTFAIFQPGPQRVQARLSSWDGWVFRGEPSPPPTTAEVTFGGTFESEWTTFKIVAMPQRLVSREELITAITVAPPQLKWLLVGYYAAQGFPVSDLRLSGTMDNPVLLDHHLREPFVLVRAPQEKIEIRYVGDLAQEQGALHNFHLGSRINRAIVPGQESFTTLAPDVEGLYRVQCDVHRKLWGWLLVQHDSLN